MPAIQFADLKKIIALNELSDDHLQWIVDHGDIKEYEDGASVGKFGDPAENMFFIIQGKVNFYMDINGHQVYYFTFENNEVTGGVGGMMPYSRMKTFPGNSFASGPTILLRLHKNHFHALEQINPDFIQKLIGYMTQRARIFATKQLQEEKVNALGMLAAGIAHELNNPAAAINRISCELGKKWKLNFKLTEEILKSKATFDQIDYLSKIVKEKDAARKNIKLSTLQRMDHEEEIADYLEKINIISYREQAETLTENGFTASEIKNISSDLGIECLASLLPWLENLLSSKKIIKDLEDASVHISTMVGAIKSHVQMDRSNDMKPTHIHTDIENTLTLLGFKLREKNIQVVKEFSEHLPEVHAFIGELNQVWTNLIDNAIYALPKNGILTIKTFYDVKNVIIQIIDNGTGIPIEIQSRIFDPFFTTKKLGEGTGIGLDLVNRIIKRHHAEIKVNSVPGNTVFEICIPILPHPEVTK